MKPETKLTLDIAAAHGCEIPGCTHDHHEIRMTSQCHPGEGVKIGYSNGSGILKIYCATCGEMIATVKVAEQ